MAIQEMNWPTARAAAAESAGNHPGAVDSLTGASGVWRTPDAPGSGGPRNRQGSTGQGHQVTIAEQAERWMFPTPAARDYRTPNSQSYQERSGLKKGEQLANFVAHTWPTATAGDAASSGMRSQNPNCHPGTSLTDATCRNSPPAPAIPDGPPSSRSAQTSRPPLRLNPRFVAWLMGFPPEWLEIGTPKP